MPTTALALELLPMPAGPDQILTTIQGIPELARDLDDIIPTDVLRTGARNVQEAAAVVAMHGWPTTPRRLVAAGGRPFIGRPASPDFYQQAIEILTDDQGGILPTPDGGPGLLDAYRRWCDPRYIARIPHPEQWADRTDRPYRLPILPDWYPLPAPVAPPEDPPASSADPVGAWLWADHQTGRWSTLDGDGSRALTRDWATHRNALAGAAVARLAAWIPWVNHLATITARPVPEIPRARRSGWA